MNMAGIDLKSTVKGWTAEVKLQQDELDATVNQQF